MITSFSQELVSEIFHLNSLPENLRFLVQCFQFINIGFVLNIFFFNVFPEVLLFFADCIFFLHRSPFIMAAFVWRVFSTLDYSQVWKYGADMNGRKKGNHLFIFNSVGVHTSLCTKHSHCRILINYRHDFSRLHPLDAWNATTNKQTWDIARHSKKWNRFSFSFEKGWNSHKKFPWFLSNQYWTLQFEFNANKNEFQLNSVYSQRKNLQYRTEIFERSFVCEFEKCQFQHSSTEPNDIIWYDLML